MDVDALSSHTPPSLSASVLLSSSVNPNSYSVIPNPPHCLSLQCRRPTLRPQAPIFPPPTRIPSPLTNSKKGLATTSKPTAIKKATAVVADPDPESDSSDPESETLLSTKKAKSSKDKSMDTIKKAVVSKPSTPAKRVTVVSADEPSAKKGKSSGLIQKVWTDEDEITVLTELVKYRAEKVWSDSKGFHAFVKDALLGNFDRKQLAGKVRNMKNKYKTSSGKKTLTPHEEKLKKLSKLIWGANSDTNSAAAVSNGCVKDSSPIVEKEQVDDEDDIGDDVEEDDDDADDESNNVCKKKKEWKFIGKKSIAMGLDADTVNAGLERCSDAVKVEIEEEWEQFHLEEAALFHKQLNLVMKETNCIIEGFEAYTK